MTGCRAGNCLRPRQNPHALSISQHGTDPYSHASFFHFDEQLLPQPQAAKPMEKGRNIKANFLLAREHECWPGSGKRYMYITYFHTRMYGCKQPGQSTTSLLTCERPQKKDPSKSFMECRFQRKSEQFLAWGSIRLTLSRWPNEVGSTMIWVGFIC